MERVGRRSEVSDLRAGAEGSKRTKIRSEAKKKIKLTKLEQTHKVRGRGLDKTGYDPKSVDKFGGIVG